jgi:hypothetical protein
MSNPIEEALTAVRQIQERIGLLLAVELPVSLGSRGDRGCLIGGKAFIYVETERPGQKHPCTNVVKYWPWLEEDVERELALVQVFVNNTHRRLLTDRIGERMTQEFGKRLRYLQLTPPLTPSDLDAIAAAVEAMNREISDDQREPREAPAAPDRS